MSKLTVYPVDQIQSVVNFLTTERDIISISESNGISTVTVQSTLLLQDRDYNYLQAGYYVQIDDINYKVLSVVDNVSFDITATGLTGTKWSLALEFRPGSRIEVNEMLNIAIQKDEEKLSRFPLLWYIIDSENVSNKAFAPPVDFEANVKLSLTNLTEIEYTASERLENNFKTTLQPYLDLIIKTIRSSYFSNVFFFEDTEVIDYREYYRYFYGSANQNVMVFDSPTDAIEFDINLQFARQYCDENNPVGQGFGIGSMFIVS
jgi:hypothetical protein